jgi:diguanylate cyclase (GGDEF)-like protein
MKELLGSAKRLAAERDEPAMYERLLVEIGELLDADVAAVFSFDGQRAIPVASTGVSDVQPVTSGAGVVGAALASVDAFVAAVALDPAFPTLVSGSMVVAPMIDGHRVTGVLVGGTKTARIMRSEDSNLLQLLAQSVVPIVATLRHHEAAADLVNVDALTGLANRRRLDGDLNGTLRAILSEGQSVAFAMVDVDHFKKFNDTFGHPAGDSLLRQVAEAISAAVRQRDVVYRYGGEEFSVLLPGASPSEARLVAERIRWAVENRQMRGEHGQSVGSVTVSIGLSCRTDLDTSALVAAADSALYRAKHEGRNRVSFG